MDRLNATHISPQSIGVLAASVGAQVEGECGQDISSFCTLEPGIPNGLSFLAQGTYAKHLCECQASAVLVGRNHVRPEGYQGCLLRVESPYHAWAHLLNRFGSHIFWGKEAIDPRANIHPSVQLSPGVRIGAYVLIGEGTVIHPNVTLYPHTEIGAHCILHAGTVIGSDGFGFAPPRKGGVGLEKIKHIGQVILEDHVEIGANSCIDRAVVGATFIGQGTKLDNLCQIGHNVRIGQSCVLAGQVGIAGSTTIGQGVQIGGQVGIAGHLTIGDYTRIGGKSGVARSFGSNMDILGYPAEEASIFRRKIAASKMKPRS